MKLKKIVIIEDYFIAITFSNNETRLFDAAKLPKNEFEKIKNKKIFNSAKIVEDKVEWGNNVSIDCKTLYKRSKGSEPNILKVDIVEKYKLKIFYKNNEIRIFDFESYIDKPLYSKFKDYEYFKKFKIFANTLYWDDVVDIAPEILYEESTLA